MANIYDMADTWNAAGTTFTAIKMNVTDTASAAASLLMDLQVGGASKARFAKSGQLLVASPSDGIAPDIAVGTTGFGFGKYSTTHVFFLVGGVGAASFSSTGLTVPDTYSYGFSAGASSVSAPDTLLSRDAAGILAQRNGTNAQASRLYFSYTDAANYTRLALKTATGVHTLETESAGTGEANIDLALTPKGTGRVRFGTLTANADVPVTGYIEVKDSGGTVRKLAVIA